MLYTFEKFLVGGACASIKHFLSASLLVSNVWAWSVAPITVHRWLRIYIRHLYKYWLYFFSLNSSNLNKTVILHYSCAEVYELNSRPRCKLHFYFFNYCNIFFLAQNQSKNHELSKSMIEQYSCRWGLTRIIDINIDSSRSLIWFLGTDFIDYK